MKIAIYARVSKDEESSDGRMQNPENQLSPLRQFANSMGWEVSAEFVDYASGGNSNRPEFQKMLGRVRQRHFDLILVWALDRFSREGMTNTLSYIKQLREYRCGLKSLQEAWLDTSQQGVSDLLLGIFSWVAEQEKKRISDRTKAALALKKAAGVKLGRPHSLNSESIISRREEIFKKFQSGDSSRKLARDYKLSSYVVKRIIDWGKKKGGLAEPSQNSS